jgi:hypothetical protein
MTNFMTVFILFAIVYWIMMIISRKQKEVANKELLQKDQFLKETQSLLKTETASFITPQVAVAVEKIQSPANTNYITQVSEYFSKQGYIITNLPKVDGLDLMGIKEGELLLIRCETQIKEIKKINLKEYIADCTLYIETNPILQGRKYLRYFITPRPITEEAQLFVRENSTSLHLLEEI